MRSAKRLDTSWKLTSPIQTTPSCAAPSMASAYYLQGLFAILRRGDGCKIERRLELAGLDQLLLDPIELLGRQRQRRFDCLVRDRVVEHEAGPLIVGLGMGDLARQRDSFRLMRKRKAQRVHLGGQELDRVVAAFRQLLG